MASRAAAHRGTLYGRHVIYDGWGFMTNKVVLASLIAVCSFGCRPAPSPENGLLGVWEIQVIENIASSSSSINNSPQPSLAIFTRSHYSLIWMPGTTGMRAFKQRWLPTDEEKIQRYGEIVVNSGKYTQTESTITAQPVVSRVPEFMGGGRLSYEYRVEGDTLSLAALTAEGSTVSWGLHLDIQVTLASGEMIAGTVVSVPNQSDPSPLVQDFAVVRLKSKPTKGFSKVELASDEETLKVGDDVVCSGFPLATPSMVTHRGMVSGFDSSGALIFVQAPINKGNSGGALLNSQGHVVGIVSMREGGISQGLND